MVEIERWTWSIGDEDWRPQYLERQLVTHEQSQVDGWKQYLVLTSHETVPCLSIRRKRKERTSPKTVASGHQTDLVPLGHVQKSPAGAVERAEPKTDVEESLKEFASKDRHHMSQRVFASCNTELQTYRFAVKDTPHRSSRFHRQWRCAGNIVEPNGFEGRMDGLARSEWLLPKCLPGQGMPMKDSSTLNLDEVAVGHVTLRRLPSTPCYSHQSHVARDVVSTFDSFVHLSVLLIFSLWHLPWQTSWPKSGVVGFRRPRGPGLNGRSDLLRPPGNMVVIVCLFACWIS